MKSTDCSDLVKTVEGWKFNTWGGLFDLIVTGPQGQTLERTKDEPGCSGIRDVCVEHEAPDYTTPRGTMTVRTWIPLDVLAEFMRDCGYTVEKK